MNLRNSTRNNSSPTHLPGYIKKIKFYKGLILTEISLLFVKERGKQENFVKKGAEWELAGVVVWREAKAREERWRGVTLGRARISEVPQHLSKKISKKKII